MVLLDCIFDHRLPGGVLLTPILFADDLFQTACELSALIGRPQLDSRSQVALSAA